MLISCTKGQYVPKRHWPKSRGPLVQAAQKSLLEWRITSLTPVRRQGQNSFVGVLVMNETPCTTPIFFCKCGG